MTVFEKVYYKMPFGSLPEWIKTVISDWRILSIFRAIFAIKNAEFRTIILGCRWGEFQFSQMESQLGKGDLMIRINELDFGRMMITPKCHIYFKPRREAALLSLLYVRNRKILYYNLSIM